MQLGYKEETWDRLTYNAPPHSLEAPGYEAWTSYSGLEDYGENPTELKPITPLGADTTLMLATPTGDNTARAATSYSSRARRGGVLQAGAGASAGNEMLRPGRRKVRKDSGAWGVVHGNELQRSVTAEAAAAQSGAVSPTVETPPPTRGNQRRNGLSPGGAE